MRKKVFCHKESLLKKGVMFFLCLYLLACSVTARHEQQERTAREEALKKQQEALKTTRIIPEDANFGAYLSGLIAKENKDWDLAATYFEKALEKDPENTQLQENLYLLRIASGHVQEALPVAKCLWQANRTDLMVSYIIWTDAFKRQDYEFLQKQINGPSNNELDGLLRVLFQAWTFVATENIPSALAALQPLKGKKETQSLYWYHYGLIGLYANQQDLVDEAFSKLKQAGVPTVSTWGIIKPYYEKTGRWNKTNPLYEDYVGLFQKHFVLMSSLPELQPETIESPVQGLAEGIHNMAVFMQASDQNIALVLNSLAFYLNPNHTMALLLSAEILEDMKMYKQASRLYETVSEPSKLIRIKMALAYILSGEQERAASVLLKLSKEYPSDPGIYKMLGDVYLSINDFKSSADYYSKALSCAVLNLSSSEVALIYMGRGTAYEKLERFAEAEQDFQRALALAPDNAILLNEVGYRWLEADKEVPQAFAMVQKAFQLMPSSPHITDSLAFAYYKLAQYDKALPLAEAAADKIPGSSVVNMHLGDIYAALERYREARYQYQKALDLKSDITRDQEQEIRAKIKGLQKRK